MTHGYRHIYTHTPHSLVNHLLWRWGAVWAGYPTRFFFAYTACVELRVLICACVCVYLLCEGWENLSFNISVRKKQHQGHILYCICAHTKSKESQNCAILNFISIQASNFSPLIHNGAVTKRGRSDRRESNKMRDKSGRWRKDKWG